MWQLGAYFDNGPLSVGVVYNRMQGSGSANLTLSSLAFARGGAGLPPGATAIGYSDLEVKSLNIGGSYDFGLLKLKATYQNDQFNTLSHNTVWGVGAEVPVMANGTVHVVYSGASVNTLSNADTKGFSVAYTHNLSKRTIAYAGYSWQGNDAAATSGIWGTSPSAGGEVNVLAAGLTHMF
ncbi:MAG: porin [Dechloromonas sp.]|nr:porin [Dechloromonas sp.]